MAEPDRPGLFGVRSDRVLDPRHHTACRARCTGEAVDVRHDLARLRDLGRLAQQIYIHADLDPLDTTQWYPKLMRKDYNVGLNITEAEVDD